MIACLSIVLLGGVASAASRSRRDRTTPYRTKQDLQVNPLAKPTKELDCAVKQLALDYAGSLLVSELHTARSALAAVALALDPTSICDLVPPPPPHASSRPPSAASIAYADALARAAAGTNAIIFVAVNGSDANDGSAAAPVQTLHHAQQLARKAGKGTTVVLHPGQYNLASVAEGGALTLTAADSGIAWMALPGLASRGETIVSGGRAIENLKWTPVTAEEQGQLGLSAAGVYKATLPATITGLEELFVDGKRQIRARYPNANPEVDIYPVGYNIQYGDPEARVSMTDIGWGPSIGDGTTGKIKTITTPVQPNQFYQYAYFLTGDDGPSRIYDPKWSWTDIPLTCDNPDDPQNLHCSDDYPHFVHGSIVFNSTQLPNAAKYTNVDQIRLRAMHDSFWGNWGFHIGAVHTDAAAGAADYVMGYANFTSGGWQEGTGSGEGEYGGVNYFVENVLQELDVEEEWYFDAATHTLYYMAAGGNAPSGSFVSSELDTLFSVSGASVADAATDITIMGIRFIGAAPTFYKPYMASGPGDWTIYNGGALYVTNATGVTIESCVFDSLGGNAIFMYGYAKNVTIRDNEFVKIGDNCVASCGVVDLVDPTNYMHGLYPSDNLIELNHMHNIGIYGKQVSGYHQTASCHNTIRDNVMYQGPRAGINFNDGMGGGNIIAGNLVFSMVTETDDHGPFNSWARIPMTTDRGMNAPAPGIIPAWSVIEHNFFIMAHSTGQGTTGGLFLLCHDDGAAHFYDRFNLLVYGGVKNYKGEQKVRAAYDCSCEERAPALTYLPSSLSLSLSLSLSSTSYAALLWQRHRAA